MLTHETNNSNDMAAVFHTKNVENTRHILSSWNPALDAQLHNRHNPSPQTERRVEYDARRALVDENACLSVLI